MSSGLRNTALIRVFGISRSPTRLTRTSAWSLKANSVMTVPGPTQCAAPVFQPDEIENLPTSQQHRINQIETSAAPQIGERGRGELPEPFLIEAVQALDFQRRAVIQHDIEQYGREQIQGQQVGNKLLGRRASRQQLSQHGQDILQVGGVTAVRVHQYL